jgi:hypothetical protein
VLIAYEDFVRLSKGERRAELTSESCQPDSAAVEGAEMERGLDHLSAEMRSQVDLAHDILMRR